MGVKSLLSKVFASYVGSKIDRWKADPVGAQRRVFEDLLSNGKRTAFGKDHHFDQVDSYASFQENVPVQDYEGIKDYIERALKGEKDVLWPDLPFYFCKTSGTTSGTKYIPISKDSMSNHIDAARNSLLMYIRETGKSDFVNGNMIFLQGSPELNTGKKVPVGRLSGIVAHHVPKYLQKNRLPSFETNCIEDWETKIQAIIGETKNAPMTLISGIPPWVQNYFEKLLEITGKSTVREVFPDFSLMVYGGVSYQPYREKLNALIGDHVDAVEVYPASEGFIAFQDSQKEEGMLLNVADGIFYEFIPMTMIHEANPQRLTVGEVEKGVNYAIVLSTNAGLWGYLIGDTVKFTSLFPHRIVVTGRIKHFTSAFGEHVIGEEVDRAMKAALEKSGASVTEFHVSPVVVASGQAAYHQWAVEFEREPSDIVSFVQTLDDTLRKANTYYNDLREGSMLDIIQLRKVQEGGFAGMMKARGKLGGQNKVPRLANDDELAKELQPWFIT